MQQVMGFTVFACWVCDIKLLTSSLKGLARTSYTVLHPFMAFSFYFDTQGLEQAL
jgi:hypothetical protein